MKRRIRFSNLAQRQYLDALRYIRERNQPAAAALHERAQSSLSRLIDHPESGRRIPEFPNVDCREVIVPPYRFFYRIEPGWVFIVNVWHDAQLPDHPPRN